MKTFLVTTDLSEDSVSAFPIAAEYARAMQAKIVILAVIEDPARTALSFAMDFPVLPDQEIQDQLRDKVTTDVKELASTHFADLDHEVIVSEALCPIFEEIVNQADTLRADLIVLASHGRSGLQRVLLGSVAERVISHAHCPTLVIPVAETGS